MEIRPAEPKDIDQMVDLLEAVAAEGRWIATEAPIDRPARRERYAAWLEDPDKQTIVADLGGRIVGVVGIEGAGLAHLGMMVAGDARGRGVGTSLVAAAIEWAREVGAYKITLDVWPHNEAALALYRKFGFEQEGLLRSHYRRKNGELWDAIVMGLVLK